ncbi:MAG: ISKra4 family transposase [Anaerolineae bacterium]|jgi:hypothetical protein
MDHSTKELEGVVSRLTRQFADRLGEWVNEVSGSQDIGLEGLEEKVQDGMHTLGGDILQELVGLVGTGKTAEPVLCPTCREPMDFVRYQGKWAETLLGPIRLERAYFHCSKCHQGHVPLDHQLGLGSDSLSGGLEEALCLLAAHMPLETAVGTLARLLRVKVDDNTVQRAVLRVGTELAEQQRRRAQQAWQAAEPPEMEVDHPPKRLYISVDGTTAHLQEGWKEVKVAAIYETETVTQEDGSTVVRAIDITYVVSFEDAPSFARYVYLEAARRGLEQAKEVVVLGDGAEWIWNRIARFCDRPVEIVDFYHASEHVWQAGQALYGEGTIETEEWVTQRLEELIEEGPVSLLNSLWLATPKAPAEAREILRRQINYFSKHKERMRYPALKEAGYHIGSGSVESACKRIIGARLKQAGMIWTPEGAEAMAQLRAAVLSDRWDPFWAHYDRTTRTYLKAA